MMTRGNLVTGTNESTNSKEIRCERTNELIPNDWTSRGPQPYLCHFVSPKRARLATHLFASETQQRRNTSRARFVASKTPCRLRVSSRPPRVQRPPATRPADLKHPGSPSDPPGIPNAREEAHGSARSDWTAAIHRWPEIHDAPVVEGMRI